MRTTMKIFAGTAGIAAVAASAPAAAQYYGNPYGYQTDRYGQAYGYGYNSGASNMAVQQCQAAVQSRLNVRGTSGILGAIFGVNTGFNGRVLSVSRVTPTRNSVTVRGLATSGRMAYSPYGYGAYGAYGANYQPDLSYKCTVDYRGYVRDVDINRR
jgi:hypothetical protein